MTIFQKIRSFFASPFPSSSSRGKGAHSSRPAMRASKSSSSPSSSSSKSSSSKSSSSPEITVGDVIPIKVLTPIDLSALREKTGAVGEKASSAIMDRTGRILGERGRSGKDLPKREKAPRYD